MKVIVFADRAGWAIDRLTKPIHQMNKDWIDMAYFTNKPDRFLATGYTKLDDQKNALLSEIGKYNIVHGQRYDSFRTWLQFLKPEQKRILGIHSERKKDISREYKRIDVVIGYTKKSVEELSKYNKNVVFIPQGVDLKKYNPINPFNTKDPAVGFIGRIISHKRTHLVMRACKELKFKFYGCGYIAQSEYWYGDDINKECLLVWKNLYPENDMNKFYSNMSMYVCLSEPNIETGPLPVLEAMACGIPVISTKVGWAKDWCEHNKNIIFIEEKDINGLKAWVEKVHYDKELRKKLITNGLELIKNFSIEKYVERNIEVYKKL